jgi:NAD(P)-dependent dehydrogenase (short-subunit alcohol dehydrogenase family)
MLLEGKAAIVSGIGPGMGRDISLALAREGCDVALGARRHEHLTPVAAEVEALGRRAVWVPTDITDPDACQNLADSAFEAFGRIDILVNNAFRNGYLVPFLEADLEKWRKSMEVNLFGTLQLTRAVVPYMQQLDDARIIMINTQSTQNIEPNLGSYAASKAALATATKTLARELGQYGIRVNGIHPGYIWGDNVKFYLQYLADERGVPFDDVYREIADQTCLGYIPDSAEIAGTVVFLASDLARPVTGQAINVSAGHILV